MSTACLEVRDLHRRFGGRVAADSFNLVVERVEYVSILGPSGSGKTTLLRMIAGLERPDRGDIVIAGKEMTGTPPWKRGVGIVFQNYALFPHLDVINNVAYPLRMRRVPKRDRLAKAAETLHRVGLGEFTGRRPYQISGGEQQRVALARALVHDPPLLLLDEPLSALDRNLREQLRVWLRRIQREFEVAVVHVTHDQEEALSLGDRVVVMNAGRAEQVGTPHDVFARPASAFVAQFFGAVVLPARVVAVEDRGSERTEVDVGFGRLRVQCLSSDEPSIGQPGWVAVRPNTCELIRHAHSGGFVGQLVASTYLGDKYEIHIAMSQDVVLRVSLTGTGDSQELREGGQVTIAQCRDAWFRPNAP